MGLNTERSVMCCRAACLSTVRLQMLAREVLVLYVRLELP